MSVNKAKLECAVDGAPSQIPTLKFLTLQHPQVAPLVHDPSNRMKILFNMFLSFICKKAHKVWYKILEFDSVAKIWLYLIFWPNPKVTSLTLGCKFYLHSVLLVIPVNLICHLTMFDFFTPWAPPAPQSSTPGTWPRRQNENHVWYVLYLSFVGKFGIKNLWNWLCN